MATKVSRASAFSPVETFQQHLALKLDAAVLSSRAETLKKRLKDRFNSLPSVYENENGSKFFDLPQTIVVLGKHFKGMEMRRSVTTKFNEDEAEKILKAKNVYAEALSSYVDQEKVLRLQQEGKLTEADIDKMFEEKESFAFWPVEGDVEE